MQIATYRKKSYLPYLKKILAKIQLFEVKIALLVLHYFDRYTLNVSVKIVVLCFKAYTQKYNLK